MDSPTPYLLLGGVRAFFLHLEEDITLRKKTWAQYKSYPRMDGDILSYILFDILIVALL